MKNSAILILIAFFFFKNDFYTQQFHSEIKIPETCIGNRFYISKFESITPFEVYQAIINDTMVNKDVILRNVENYNLMIFRRLNNQIMNLFSKHKDSSLYVFHARDIFENQSDNFRFVIRPLTTKEAILKGERLNEKFYIYDQKLKISYQPFPNLDILLISLIKTNNYFKKKKSSEITQEKVNKFCVTATPKEKKVREKNGRFGAIIMQVIFYVAIPIVAYVLSN